MNIVETDNRILILHARITQDIEPDQRPADIGITHPDVIHRRTGLQQQGHVRLDINLLQGNVALHDVLGSGVKTAVPVTMVKMQVEPQVARTLEVDVPEHDVAHPGCQGNIFVLQHGPDMSVGKFPGSGRMGRRHGGRHFAMLMQSR